MRGVKEEVAKVATHEDEEEDGEGGSEFEYITIDDGYGSVTADDGDDASSMASSAAG